MENLEVVLEQTAQGDTVVKAQNLSVNVEINGGNITVSGQQVLTLLGGKEQVQPMPMTSVRLGEVDQILTNMPEAEKAKLEAKKAAWSSFHSTVKAALKKALAANYLIENPIEQTV